MADSHNIVQYGFGFQIGRYKWKVKTANPGRNSIAHFSTLKKLDKPLGTGALICMLETHLPLANDINAVPFGCIG
jgi:hypothetical protein